MKKLILACLFVAIALQNTARAQQQKSGWTFAALEQALTDAAFATSPGYIVDNKTIDAISKDLDNIRSGYLNKYGTDADTEVSIALHVAPEYSTSMVANLTTLQELPTKPSARSAALNDVYADIDIKSRVAAKTMGFLTTVFPSTVKLAITVKLPSGTLVSSSDVSVRANPHHLGATSSPSYILSTSAAAHIALLPPGRFLIWVEVGGKVLKPKDADIGLDPLNPQPIDFDLTGVL